MRFKMVVMLQRTGATWSEHHDRVAVTDDRSAQAAASFMIHAFNKTLREGEAPRTLVTAVLAGPTIGGQHEWRKASLVTESSNGKHYDRMECEACGITAKRYGFTNLVRDKKYASIIYDTCNPPPIKPEQTPTQEPSPMPTIHDLTDWYGLADGPPVHVGAYETCANPDRPEPVPMYRWWSGSAWSSPYRTLDQLHMSVDKARSRPPTVPPLYWRGVKTPPPLTVVPTSAPLAKRERKALVDEEQDDPAQLALFAVLENKPRARRVLIEE
jgi:hypothetical protein